MSPLIIKIEERPEKKETQKEDEATSRTLRKLFVIRIFKLIYQEGMDFFFLPSRNQFFLPVFSFCFFQFLVYNVFFTVIKSLVSDLDTFLLLWSL